MTCCESESFITKARHRINIEEQILIDDEVGGQEITWTNFMTVWAIVEPRQGKEVFVNEQLQSRVNTVITIRYIEQLKDTTETAKYRIVLDSRIYNILAVNNVRHLPSGKFSQMFEGKEYQILYCEEGAKS